MRFFLSTLSLGGILVGLLISTPRSHGCAIVVPKGQWANLYGEYALIIWDSQSKIQHFVRSASFQSGSANFGFLVPTPTKPELAVATYTFFWSSLEKLTAPRTVVQERTASLGCAADQVSFSTVGSAVPGYAVTVLEEKKVGDYDTAILKATDAEALRVWLRDHGYDARPELTNWLKKYVDNGWVVTAFKVSANAKIVGGGNSGASIAPIRLSFAAEQPFYPYREPVDQPFSGTGAVAGLPRLLKLYVLSDARVSATLGNSGVVYEAPGMRTVWANSIESSHFEQAATAAGLAPDAVQSLAGRTWWLTEFEDRSSPRLATDEVYFSRSPDQSTIERPPHVRYVDVYWPWYLAAGIAFFTGLLLIAVCIVLIRRLIRRLPSSPYEPM